MVKEEYNRLLNFDLEDKDLVNRLKSLTDGQVNDSFYRDLQFGTGELRGLIGAGANRMNIYVVAKAIQGLAD